MTVDDWLAQARAALGSFQPSADAAREARLLFAYATGWSGARVATSGPDPLPEAHRAAADAALARRLEREPVAQIVGQWPFYGRPFRTSAATLTPRPDTETLIDFALSGQFDNVLDLGTGTGILAVTLLAERPTARGLATDISPDALAIAAENATRHGVRDRLGLRPSQWWEGIAATEVFDLVVCNPPYISAGEYAALPPELALWEPRVALTPGGDGLDAYRAISMGLAGHLAPGGRCLLEIGATQGADVARLLAGAGLEDLTVHPDINLKPRVVAATMPLGHDA